CVFTQRAFPSLSVTRAGALRALHSFPTRRSSDLCRACPSCEIAAGLLAPPEAPLLCANRFLISRSTGVSGVISQRRISSCSTMTDRKSTRLNSSHVKISYAVFCLKKKKHLRDRYF